MADLQTILERLATLESEVASLKAAKVTAGSPNLDSIAYLEGLPPTAVVGKDYVAYRFGCSVRAILNGEKSTADIRRVSKSPLKFIKREVDAAFEKQKKQPVKKKAAELRKISKKRIYSTVKKNPSTEQTI